MEPTKHDNGKDRWDLLPIREVEQEVKVHTYGAKKYADYNWQKVVTENPDRYYAACLRHLAAWRKGEIIDPESGQPHLAHASCCLRYLMWYDNELP